MPTLISKDDILRVKETADIADLISRSGVTLKASGVNSWSGLCPFHDEKSPSFTVRPTHGTYRCFGCGQSGDAITYVQEKEGMTFAEAVRYVAEMYGVQIHEEEEDTSGPSRKRLLELMATAGKYYADQYAALNEVHPARQELIKRDLQLWAGESRVGYAPEGWTHLKDHLAELGFTEEDMLATGVISTSDKGRTYDAFRGRLTWEIHDIAGRTIGFGARKLFDSDGGPKYLNTPETTLYHKSSVLYGLDTARQDAAKQSKIFVVEGYTDVMAFRAAGINNVVASCGTAFGEQHANTIRRLIGERGTLVFCFDGDEAGLAAARKTFNLKAPIHASSTVVVFEGGDPCDLRLKDGNSGLLAALENPKPLVDFVLRHEMRRFDVTSSEGRARYLAEATPLLASIPDPSLREDYTSKVTLWSGSMLNTVSNMVTNAARAARNNAPQPPRVDHDEEHPPEYEDEYSEEAPTASKRVEPEGELSVRERNLLGLLVQHPFAASRAIQTLGLTGDFFSKFYRPLATQIIDIIKDDPDKVENMHPDRTVDPELMTRMIEHSYPMLERMVHTGRLTTGSVERMIVQTAMSVKKLRTFEQAASLRASIAGSFSPSGDTSILVDIAAAQDKIRRQ